MVPTVALVCDYLCAEYHSSLGTDLGFDLRTYISSPVGTSVHIDVCMYVYIQNLKMI